MRAELLIFETIISAWGIEVMNFSKGLTKCFVCMSMTSFSQLLTGALGKLLIFFSHNKFFFKICKFCSFFCLDTESTSPWST